MPINNDLPVVEFPMKLYWNEEPTTEFQTEKQAVKVTMLDYPKGDFREKCYKMILSTWEREPVTEYTSEQVSTAFKELLTGKVLPNSMESLNFSFLIEGLSLIEITHLLRHRLFYSIHALTTGERDLRHDKVLVPESILTSKFAEEYMDLQMKCKELYAKMLDSKEVSLMDARYLLPRAHLYYYHVSMNLKDAIAFINQRKCTMIQPPIDNFLAEEMYKQIITVIPELKDIISLKCDKRCHFIVGALEKNTRLYLPDKTHGALYDYNPKNFLYGKTRVEMGLPKTIQDE